MFTRDGLLTLHRWTHYSLEKLLAHCATMPAELWTQPVEGFPHGDLRAQCVHILETEEYWLWKLAHPRAADTELPEWQAADFPDLAALESRRQEVAAATRAYLEGTTDEALSAPVALDWPERQVSTHDRPAAFYVLHALTHAFHHKGQAAALCRLLGHPTGSTDLRFSPFTPR